MSYKNSIKKVILFFAIFLFVIAISNICNANEYFGARKYSFTDEEIRRIASMC